MFFEFTIVLVNKKKTIYFFFSTIQPSVSDIKRNRKNKIIVGDEIYRVSFFIVFFLLSITKRSSSSSIISPFPFRSRFLSSTVVLEGRTLAVEHARVEESWSNELFQNFIGRAPMKLICDWKDLTSMMGKMLLPVMGSLRKFQLRLDIIDLFTKFILTRPFLM